MKLKVTMMLAAALAMAAAGPLAAQEQGAPEQAPPGAEQAEVWLAEAQGISRQLAGLQQQVLADPQIAQQRAELTARVEQAMAAADPTLEEELAHASELEPAMAAAQEAGDDERLEELVIQARELETRFLQAQRTALEDPELSRVVLAFNERMRDRMAELDPETPRLIERLEELGQMLQTATQ
ncbi:MAG TPA: hypothetical protein VMN78_13690 [Longimicrobiales bacterium]|nr:hypothetical protein [Longimicrobiales bacterium]